MPQTCLSNSKRPASRPRGVLTQAQWNEMHDCLTLALDALGDGPKDVDYDFIVNCIMHQRIALRIAHARMDKLKGGAE